MKKKEQKLKPAEYTKNDFENAINLLKNEQAKLATRIAEYKKLMSEPTGTHSYHVGCGKKRGAIAKQKQLDIIYALLLLQQALKIKFTADFSNKIAKHYTKKTIQKQLLYKFFSYKKQNNIIFNKNVSVEDFVKNDFFNVLLEKATIKNSTEVMSLSKNNNKKEQHKITNILKNNTI